MEFELVDSGWDRRLDEAVRADGTDLLVVSPFIKLAAAKRLYAGGRPKSVRVLTRFNKADFFERVSDLDALHWLLEQGAEIRGIRNLHAKLYVFGRSNAILTSANLTESALTRNLEFGFVSSKDDIISSCRAYFDALWNQAAPSLKQSRLNEWKQELVGLAAAGGRPSKVSGLTDEGASVFVSAPEVELPVPVVEAPQAFVKFFGSSGDRAEWTCPVMEEVDRAGCHFACTYPVNKRPRGVQSGAVMFMARMVEAPNDYLIFGRGEATAYENGRDDASPDDLAKRKWKAKWPHYIRVHGVAFVAGTLSNGVSLNALIDELGSDVFATTQRNRTGGHGNTSPRLALRRQPAVELSPEGHRRLSELLEKAFRDHGRIPSVELEALDWPQAELASAGPRHAA